MKSKSDGIKIKDFAFLCRICKVRGDKMSLLKIVSEEEAEEKAKRTYGDRMVKDEPGYEPYSITNFHLTNRNLLKYNNIDYTDKEDFKKFWQAGLLAIICFYILPLCITHFSEHTLFVISAIVFSIGALMDIISRSMYHGFILGLDMIVIVWFVVQWIRIPPSITVVISFVVTFGIVSWLNRTVAFSCGVPDRLGWYFLFFYMPLMIPNQYLVISYLLLLVYYISTSVVCYYIIGPRLKKIGFPVLVQVWIAFVIISLIWKNII